MNKPDLHIHSKYSIDGEAEVSDITGQCAENHVDVYAVTDHNTVAGIKEALDATPEEILFIPGIEIDCHFNGTDLHLLGYRINWWSRDFSDLESTFTGKMMEAFNEMIHNISKLGFMVDAGEVLERANGKPPSGELIAEVMLSDGKYETGPLKPYMPGGARSDMPYINFYLDYFAQNKPAYVPVDYMSYKDAVELVGDNGGIPVVAHPGLNFKGKEDTVEKLLDKGAKGLEVFNNYHDEPQTRYFAKVVQNRQALMTCGSDFHGKTKPKIRIGEYGDTSSCHDYLMGSIKQLPPLPSV